MKMKRYILAALVLVMSMSGAYAQTTAPSPAPTTTTAAKTATETAVRTTTPRGDQLLWQGPTGSRPSDYPQGFVDPTVTTCDPKMFPAVLGTAVGWGAGRGRLEQDDLDQNRAYDVMAEGATDAWAYVVGNTGLMNGDSAGVYCVKWEQLVTTNEELKRLAALIGQKYKEIDGKVVAFDTRMHEVEKNIARFLDGNFFFGVGGLYSGDLVGAHLDISITLTSQHMRGFGVAFGGNGCGGKFQQTPDVSLTASCIAGWVGPAWRVPGEGMKDLNLILAVEAIGIRGTYVGTTNVMVSRWGAGRVQITPFKKAPGFTVSLSAGYTFNDRQGLRKKGLTGDLALGYSF